MSADTKPTTPLDTLAELSRRIDRLVTERDALIVELNESRTRHEAACTALAKLTIERAAERANLLAACKAMVEYAGHECGAEPEDCEHLPDLYVRTRDLAVAAILAAEDA